MDNIFIKRLEVDCTIGIFKRERKIKQKVWIDLEIPCDAASASKTDHIHDAVNYKRIAKTALKLAAESKFRLIETLAETLAQRIIKDFELPWITLSISKPGAIRFSENVGVSITRYAKIAKSLDDHKELAYINVGSNVNREKKISDGLKALRESFELGRISSVYESSAVGHEDAAPFWNLMVEAKAPMRSETFKAKLLQLERKLGRKRTQDKYASRTIDFDLIFHGARVVKQKRLRIPHPDSYTAPYIIAPMAEIRPDYRHPESGLTMIEMMGERLDPQGHFRKIKTPAFN